MWLYSVKSCWKFKEHETNVSPWLSKCTNTVQNMKNCILNTSVPSVCMQIAMGQENQSLKPASVKENYPLEDFHNCWCQRNWPEIVQWHNRRVVWNRQYARGLPHGRYFTRNEGLIENDTENRTYSCSASYSKMLGFILFGRAALFGFVLWSCRRTLSSVTVMHSPLSSSGALVSLSVRLFLALLKSWRSQRA